MNNENSVSLWLGNMEEATFNEYFEIKYTEDGDSIPSSFEENFKLGYYDRDLVEKFWAEERSDNIEILLEDFSYDNQIIEQFRSVNLSEGYNTIILIYNYEYSGNMKTSTYKNGTLNFIGVSTYVDE
ncbi:immunity 22 family protein [Listeria grandensis]|uniref:immunity 22 family protein n=1 Tax=Listeria grandensis TaxID=1494963 RepID=UPI00164E47DA|nr:immunity 22 family protein [Listeria grandensis]MBC6314043.1 immunity 22 family protein [Listeria grandensis]